MEEKMFYNKDGITVSNSRFVVVRYADDFIVTAKTEK